ncbi:macro domain-like protein [Stipitochalara longipes BDJ]|nr:macro domain-like protein [Stipitochalara longipes BDJ]
MVSPGTSLTGERGTLILRSPDSHLEIRRANPSTFPAEAVVHATNSSMTLNTTSVNGALNYLVHAAGSELRAHLRYNYPSGLRTGDVLTSPSFEMKNCHYIIHVNGPDFHRKRSRRSCIPLLKQQLADCYRRALEEAFKLGVKSVVFPCIGTGMLGWPRGEAARIGVAVVRAWLRHRIHGEKRRAVLRKVMFLAGGVGGEGHQAQAWCTAFREFWPQMSMPRRISFLDYVDRQEQRRLEKDTNQLIENQGPVVVVALAPAPCTPVVTREVTIKTRELRRSRRTRKRPERYGQ